MSVELSTSLSSSVVSLKELPRGILSYFDHQITVKLKET